MLTLPVRISLWCAVLVPVTYFGAQIFAAPFYPGYSVYSVTASDLGSDKSSLPIILNAGAVLTGIFAVFGAPGLVGSLPKFFVNVFVAWLLAACMASAGFAAIWAGTHPLPHPDHNPGVLGAGMFAAPFVAAVAIWQMRCARTIKIFSLLNLLAFFAVGLVMSGFAGIDVQAYGALFQKFLAAISFFTECRDCSVGASFVT